MSLDGIHASQFGAVVLAALGSEPVKLFRRRRIGTAKALRWGQFGVPSGILGQDVASRCPGIRDDGAALVIDDVHLLPDSELLRLIELAEDPDRTVVVATEARESRSGPGRPGSALEANTDESALGRLPIADTPARRPDPVRPSPPADQLRPPPRQPAASPCWWRWWSSQRVPDRHGGGAGCGLRAPRAITTP